MAGPDAFALTTSNLNPFLFAAVGMQMNGSELTTLSLLARLGSDPWAEAGRLAALPKAAAADWLAARIEQTPLTQQDIGHAGEKAMWLVSLLPSRGAVRATPTAASAAIGTAQAPSWAMITLVCCALAIGLMASALHDPAPQSAPAAAAQPAQPAQPGQ